MLIQSLAQPNWILLANFLLLVMARSITPVLMMITVKTFMANPGAQSRKIQSLMNISVVNMVFAMTLTPAKQFQLNQRNGETLLPQRTYSYCKTIKVGLIYKEELSTYSFYVFLYIYIFTAA